MNLMEEYEEFKESDCSYVKGLADALTEVIAGNE